MISALEKHSYNVNIFLGNCYSTALAGLLTDELIQLEHSEIGS